ncbi:MAG TPA: DNA repair protein RecN [Candidatus Egerieimonas intestinavium]|uniref:DNA repair protein RecN n=1 Tax=Candidatus Egerieimonas intestinavium TaxID=2840777 RepID=A0A9D1EJJ0_9FIRM|nr:DNA repair protein RecN [Candidatus Egerieimonas intestinavium]
MLASLHVKNLALIDEIEVDFTRGLNILTGETGAGKSLLLGSVNLALGKKMPREIIREGASYALVELIFQVDTPQTLQALEELDIYPEEGQVVISRRITEGRSSSRINGETCTAARVKAAASLLLDIHGQHEHQSLLYPENQMGILDAYGKVQIASVLEEAEKAYDSYQKKKRELQGCQMDEEQRRREMDFLSFEIDEIREADLQPGEDEELESQYRLLLNSQKIQESLREAHQATGYESGDGAGEQVGRALRELSRVSELDGKLSELAALLSDVDSLLNDFNRELSGCMADFTFSEENFYQTEQRLDLINRLKAKYGNSIEEIKAYEKAQEKKLEQLQNLEEHREELEREAEEAKAKLKKICDKLRQLRISYGERMEKEIVQSLRELNFLDVRFKIQVRELDHFTRKGSEEVEFFISTNPGEPLRPLAKVASGGELSRIMLAIKAMLADKDEIETLIFDEIDTGISGRTAQRVSEKMVQIGRSRQVICITHLAQIAAMADTHFLIEKNVEKGETKTRIYSLKEEESVAELARILGGARITENTMESAQEMKELARIHKNASVKT